jgi:hypothetical protein
LILYSQSITSVSNRLSRFLAPVQGRRVNGTKTYERYVYKDAKVLPRHLEQFQVLEKVDFDSNVTVEIIYTAKKKSGTGNVLYGRFPRDPYCPSLIQNYRINSAETLEYYKAVPKPSNFRPHLARYPFFASFTYMLSK